MGPVCEACSGTGQIGEQACVKCDGVGMPEERSTTDTIATTDEKEATETNPEAVGPAHVEQALAPGATTVPIHSDVEPGNDASEGIQGGGAPSVSEGAGLPPRDGGSGLSDVGSGDDGDLWQDTVPEWEVVDTNFDGPVLEPAEAARATPHVTRAQADRIVTLIGQGWDPETIFERVGVGIVPD